MSTQRPQARICALLLSFFLFSAASLRAEVDDSGDNNAVQDSTTVNSSDATSAPATPAAPSTPTHRKHKASTSRHYLTDTPGRSDAGVFHVGFGVGGNLFIEPQSDPTTGLAEGAYYKDFGFGVGVFFDYDYSETDPNIPLELRGMVGYNYILSSVHMFTFDGVVRRVFKLAENATFGLGGGVSTAIWYRTITSTSSQEQVVFLPSAIINAGFDFNPMFVDFKWLINRIGSNSDIMGWELWFGVRI